VKILFIGGPYHGTVKDISPQHIEGSYYKYPILEPSYFSLSEEPLTHDTLISIKEGYYRREKFHIGRNIIPIFVEEMEPILVAEIYLFERLIKCLGVDFI